MSNPFGVMAGLGVLFLCFFLGLAAMIWAEATHVSETTVHKSQDRIPYTCTDRGGE